MQKIKWALALAGLLGLATAASASNYSCSGAADTWCFVPSSNGLVSDGSTYSSQTGNLGTVTVYSEQVKNSNNSFVSFSDSTINGLFAVNDSANDEGEGIAPFNPVETSSNFSSQDGITDAVGTNNFGSTNSTYGNVLLLELGSNIAQGTTLKFMLEAGAGASTDIVSDYFQDGGSVNVGMNQGISLSGMTLNGTTTAGEITTNNNSFAPQSQLTLTKNTSGVEWVAIEADCHYLLLSSIQGTPGSSVPEPRFYGLLLASLLGLAGVVYQRRRAAQVNA